MIRPRSCQLRQTTFRSNVLNATTAIVAIALTVGFCAGPAVAQFTNGTMTCELSSNTASPSTSVTLDLFLEDAVDVRGYQATIQITRTSGSGEVTVPCPGGVAVDENRPDFIFPDFDSENLEPDCPDCGIVVPDCDGQRVAVARVTGGVNVADAPANLATFTLDVSPDAALGSTFEISIVPFPASIVGGSDKTSIPFDIGPPCELTISAGGQVCRNNIREGTETCDGTDDDMCPGFCDSDCNCPKIPTVSHWGLAILALLLLTTAKIYFGRRGPRTTGGSASLLAALVLVLGMTNTASAGEVTGACCLGGLCSPTTQGECSAEGGTYGGDGTTCEGDADGDGVDAMCGDNCPATSNPDQADADGDGVGDACDICPEHPGPCQLCETHADCNDGDVCTFGQCIDGLCSYTPGIHADVTGTGDDCIADGAVTEDDVQIVGSAFSGDLPPNCPPERADIKSSNACEPDGKVDLFDILAVMDAFRGEPNCPCTPPPSRRTDVDPNKTDRGTPTCSCAVCEEGDSTGLMDPVYLFSGEFYECVVDMQIPGRGLDFTWSRKYRSKIGPDTAMGNGWDFSYNISIERNDQDLVLHDGNSRSDTYIAQPNGTWTRREFFRVIEQNPNGSFTLTFSDTGNWNLHPLNGSPDEGKIASIVDRNGNELTFDYDASGRLVTIHDPLDTPAHNRDITIAYNADGFIESVTDFAGRSVTYEYYDGVEPGGNLGDLKSMTTPAVVNTPDFPIPPGHEYPNGKTTAYTYSTGFADDRLNHNLLTITDPKGQTYLVNEYDPTEDPDALNYDRIKRQTWGDPGDVIDLVYLAQAPTPTNDFAITKVIYNDRVGNVKEFFYDARNRGVISREYTGRADPDLPTTEGANRPTGQLRPDDPEFFETHYEYNEDSQRTRIMHPNGNADVRAYDTANPDRRSQGNMIQQCDLPGLLGGDQAEICETFEYDDGFGGCCGSNFITKHVDGRGNETLHTYDANGNRTHSQHRIPSIVEDWQYNQFGQMTAHILPDNGSGHRRRDEYTYYDSGPQLGYHHQAIVDAPNFALTTTYEYNLVGQMTRVTDPRGHDSQSIINQLDRTVRSLSREVSDGSGVYYERNTYYDPNDNVVRTDIQNVDDSGIEVASNAHFTTIYEYEFLNYRTRTCQEVGTYTGAVPGTQQVPICTGLPDSEFITTENEYDANRNRTLVRYGEAVEGRQPANVTETRYDERDLTLRQIRAPGDPDQSTTQYDYDNNRNITKVHQGLEDTPRISTSAYDGYDRMVRSTDPMGNEATHHYDPNSNRVSTRTDGELTDVPGNAGNLRLSEATYAYDAMDRLIRTDVEFFDTDTQTDIDDGKSTAQTSYNDNSQVIRVVNDNGHEGLTAYDTANRPSVVTDHLNNTMTYSYDANSNVIAMTDIEKSDLGNPDEGFTTTSAYDNLDRVIQTVDNIGNTHVYAFDSRDNRTRLTDALGRETRYVYDGVNRLVKTVRDLDGFGANINAVPGDGDADIVTAQTWDDTSRLIAQIDDSDNATRYAYDALNRLIVTQMADGTIHQTGSGAAWAKGQPQPDLGGFTSGYDVHDNRITIADANGSVSTSTYDLLDRLINKTIVPGAGVSSDTTFEVYKYDGLSRLVHAEDDDSVVTRAYDSLSRETRETLNGQTTTDVYDGVGNQLTCTYPGARVVTNTYDELERKKMISDSGGTIATYDYVGPGRVERREYGNGTRTDYAYDGITGIPNPPGDFGVKRIIRTKHSRISDGTILDDRTYTWDRMYNKTQREDVRAGGPRLTHDYTYDRIYRLVHTTVTDAGAIVVRDTEYDLDGVANRTTVAGAPDPGPHVGAYTMDATQPEPADAQVNQYTTTSADARVYDDNGNLIRIDDALPTRRDIVYDYRNQMVEYIDAEAGVRHTYAYDALGRRIAKRSAEYELTPCGPNPAANSCSSDAGCALGTACVDTGFCPPGGCSCEGLFFICTDDCSFECEVLETHYFYHGWRVVEEQDALGTTQATYVYGLYIDEVLTMRRTSSLGRSVASSLDFYYHTDDLYNVMALTDATGTVAERYEYADYGQPLDPSSLSGSVAPSLLLNPYLFTGRRYDPETGWYYYRTRYLDSTAGRFTTRDTIGIWGDKANRGNGYSYSGSNPIGRLDPFGLDSRRHEREYKLMDKDWPSADDHVATLKWKTAWKCTVADGLELLSEGYNWVKEDLQGAEVSTTGEVKEEGKYSATMRYLGSGSWEEWSFWGAVGGGMAGVLLGVEIGGSMGMGGGPAGAAGGAIIGGIIQGAIGVITGALKFQSEATATVDLKYRVRCCTKNGDDRIIYSTIWENVNDSTGDLYWGEHSSSQGRLRR